LARDDQPSTQTVAGENYWLTLARRITREYQLRREVMPQIDEPRWMILLEIFTCTAEGREIPFMSAAHAAGVAISSGQRYVHNLVDTGLVIQHRSVADQRVTLVKLSRIGAVLVEETLATLADKRGRD
jgi:DNA-binding MarR family transcriptional regulator